MTSPRTPKSDEPRINRQIDAQRIRLIDTNGDMLGIVPILEGIRKAEAAGLDLVEIVPNAEPPVCKILDVGKYKYELQKKAHEAKRKQKVISVKELKLRPTIDKHDLEIKIRNAEQFLAEGDKVKFSLKFRGREMSHQELGHQIIARVQEALAEHGKIESAARMEGSQITLTMGPK